MNRKPTPGVSRTNPHASPAAIEPLESRLVFDAAFASTGLFYQPGSDGQEAITFGTEGVLSSILAAAGASYRDGSGDREFQGDLAYDSITNLADGRFERNPPDGFFGEPDERNGARFLNDDDYPAGWWFGQYSTNAKEIEFVVQRASDVTRGNFQGDYRFTEIWRREEDSDAQMAVGRLTITSSELIYSASAGSIPYARSAIQSTTATGLLKTARGEYVYLNASRSTIIWADLNTSDGIVALGVATRESAPIPAADLTGGFLVVANNNRSGLDFQQYFLDLEADGDYKYYDLDDYDDGGRDSISKGFWSVSGSTLTLRSDTVEDVAHFTIGENGNLLVQQNTDRSGVQEPEFSLGVRAQPNGPPPPTPTVVFPVGAVNEFGRGDVYELDSNDRWFVTDLVLTAGGPSITGKIVTWTDPKDHLTYAAGLSDQGLVLYSSTADHVWTFRVLTTEAAAPPIASELQAMTGPDGIISLTGLSAAGELLRHYQTGSRDSAGRWAWAFQNISATDLASQGLTTPAFTGLVSYATAWNGLNVAGLDSAGTIWSVWWSPGLPAWTVSNLTTAFGAVPLAGGLTVYLTPWQGINIAGIDDAGHLQVTWWVPAFEGDWEQTDLTQLTGGPLLAPGTVTSYTSSWGGLNVAGLDTATGDVFVYWWAPGNDWAVTSLTDAVPAGSPPLVGPIMGLAAPDSSLNVFGYNGDHFIRYFWEPDATWTTQDLTAIATPR